MRNALLKILGLLLAICGAALLPPATVSYMDADGHLEFFVTAAAVGMLLGTALGGFIAEQWGLAAPFWFGFVGSGITLILIWKSLGSIAHADSGE